MSWEKRFTFSVPVQLTCGRAALDSLGAILAARGSRRALVVIDPGVLRAHDDVPVRASLERAGVQMGLFSAVEPDPGIAGVRSCGAALREGGFDGLVAVGGGSAMDTAKVAALLARHGGEPTDYEGVDRVPGPLLPFVCVPTTCGTGSEVTRNAVVTDPARRFKFTIRSTHLQPFAAILDPDLLAGLPAAVVASTAMDALTHALESFTNRNAQPMAEACAREAMRRIGRHIRPAVHSRGIADLGELLVASTLAGISLDACGVGLVHAMSAPVGGVFGIAHGVANAVLLPYVTEYNWSGAPERYAEGATILAGRPSAAEDCAPLLRQMNRDLGIPETLGALGATLEPLEHLLDYTFRSRNIAINPRPPAREEVAELFRRAVGVG